MLKFAALLLATLFINCLWAIPQPSQQKVSPFVYALKTGTDVHGKALYLCLAQLFDSVQPGKTWPGSDQCLVPYAGKEYIVNQFTIPNEHEFNPYIWMHGAQKAIVIGKDSNGRSLFLCQTNFNGSEQPGKTWQGYNHCNISFNGLEIITDDYRVLSK